MGVCASAIVIVTMRVKLQHLRENEKVWVVF